MDSMRVRMARCMFERRYPPSMSTLNWETQNKGRQSYYLELADAALEALKEPNGPMVEAGGDIRPFGEPFDFGDESATEVWRAMIAEASK